MTVLTQERELLTAPDSPDDVNLVDRVVHATFDLSSYWSHVRQHHPVWFHPSVDGRRGFWVLSRHADVMAVYKDRSAWTSEQGNVLDALTLGGDSAGGKMLSLTDGQRHRQVRHILTRTFSISGLEALGRIIRGAAAQLIAERLEAGGGDFALHVAKQIPLQAICDILGVPLAERERIFTLTSSMVASEDPDQPFSQAWEAKNDVLLYFSLLAEERASGAGKDLVSHLVGPAGKNIGLSEEEVVFNCYSLILGGGETTRMAISGGILALLQHPEQWDAYVRGEIETGRLVEEILRWTSPSMHLARTATRDVTIHGQVIPKGDIVTVWNVSSNRDQRAFDDADQFNAARIDNPHTALGAGSHFCLGSHLARLEIAAVLEAFRDATGTFELAGQPRRIYSNFLGGINSLPLRMSPK